MASLFNLLVNIAANTAQLESGLNRAADKIDEFSRKIQKTAEGLAAFAGLSVGVDALGDSIKRAVDSGSRLQTLSDRMGTSAESLSRLQFAAKISEVPFDSLTGAIDHLHETLGRAELGSGRAGKALAAMGIDAKKLLDLPFDQQLATVANKLGQIDNAGQRAAREMILFGQAGAQLDPLFRQGSAGIQSLLTQADELGITLDGKMTEQLKRAHEEMVKADSAWEKASATLATAFAPALEDAAKLVERLGSGLSRFGDFLRGPQTNADAFRQKIADLREEYNALNQTLEADQALQSNEFLSNPITGKRIEDTKQKIADVASALNVYNEQLRKEIDLSNQAGSKKGGVGDVAPVNLGVTLDNQKIFTDRMTELLNQFQADTETDLEKTAAAWYKFEAELKDLRDSGLISQEQYGQRLGESLDKILPGADKVKEKIEIPVRDQLTEMQRLSERAAQSIQGAFANFLFDPFHDSLRKFAQEFVQSLQRMAADAAAADIFKHLFPGDPGNAKGAGNSGLGGDLYKYLGKFFEGTPQGTPGGGQSTAGKLLGGLSGVFGKLITSLLGGGGSAGISSSDWQGAYDSLAALPTAMAEGGLVSAGSTYLVGEEGPELFTASSHGMITPNDQLGGGDTHVHMGDIHIDARGADADRVLTLVPPMVRQEVQRGHAQLLQAFRRTGLAAPVRV